MGVSVGSGSRGRSRGTVMVVAASKIVKSGRASSSNRGRASTRRTTAQPTSTTTSETALAATTKPCSEQTSTSSTGASTKPRSEQTRTSKTGTTTDPFSEQPTSSTTTAVTTPKRAPKPVHPSQNLSPTLPRRLAYELAVPPPPPRSNMAPVKGNTVRSSRLASRELSLALTQAETMAFTTSKNMACCVSDFPIYINSAEFVELWVSGSSGSSFGTWLNGTTLDSIVMFSGGKRGTQSFGDRKKAYLGSQFTSAAFDSTEACQLWTRKMQKVLDQFDTVILVWHTRQHWLLVTLNSKSCTVYDPMSSSSVEASLLSFLAMLYGREHELESVSNRCSVRAGKVNLSFFNLVNVGVQLEENEGYNCGMYCALWARELLFCHSTSWYPRRFTKDELAHQRVVWQARLLNNPSFVQRCPSEWGGTED